MSFCIMNDDLKGREKEIERERERIDTDNEIGI